MKEGGENIFLEIPAAFGRAWRLLIDLPLPEAFDSEDHELHPALVMLNFPVIGAILGAAGYFISWLLTYFPGQLTGSIISAIIISGGLEVLSGGRNLGIAGSFFEMSLFKSSEGEPLLELNDDVTSARRPSEVIVMICLFLLRTFFVGLLIYSGASFWLITFLTAAHTVQAQLATAPTIEDGEAILPVEPSLTVYPWLIAAVIMVVTGWVCLPGVVLAFVLALILASLQRKYCIMKIGGVNGSIIGLAGYVTEIILLLTGIIFLVRQ